MRHDERPFLRPVRRLATLIATVLMVSACGRSTGDAEPSPSARGIASLSPAMTTIVRDLGDGDRLVGRTPWCRGVDDRPVVGALDGVDAELLARLRPAVVLVQPAATGPDPMVLALHERLGFELVVRRLDGGRDVLAVLDDLEAAGVGDPARRAERRSAIAAVLEAAASESARPSVLVLHSVDPFGAAGQRTFLDEVVRAAGGRNALDRSGWVELGAEEVVRLAPEIVLLVSGGLLETGGLDTLPWVDRPRVLRLESQDALEPSTRMPEIVATLKRLLAGSTT